MFFCNVLFATTAALVLETETGVGVVITPETAIAGYGGGIIAVAIGAGQLNAATKHAAETQNWINQHKPKGGGGESTPTPTYKKPKETLPEGFKETKEFGRQHGQKVYEKGNKYYSKDVDSHNGGAWKVFEKNGKKLKRIGTADKDLNIFKQ